ESGPLEAVVARALAPDPARRYASGTAFAEALDRFLANPSGAPEGRRLPVAPLAVLGIVVAVATSLAVVRVLRPEARPTSADATRRRTPPPSKAPRAPTRLKPPLAEPTAAELLDLASDAEGASLLEAAARDALVLDGHEVEPALAQARGSPGEAPLETLAALA